MSSVRIISGTLGGRRIKTIKNKNLKPTPEKLREQLFSWIRPELSGARCLDLFAGSGALGFEALSNGASEVVMVEQNPDIYRNLKENRELLGAESAINLLRQSAEDFIRRTNEKKFDFIFFDPPYIKDYVKQLIPKLLTKLAEDNVKIYIETDSHETIQINSEICLINSSSSGKAKGYLYELITN
ncbi:MAG: 16S rRNA (guanine(966)-N(2))-methyltransferase RsmD [Proteobacteria bacterium]|nr:16S rRNA (guanine(966)-N(2))-methyltransferase RsmD [Pseudomonadota bacterium]